MKVKVCGLRDEKNIIELAGLMPSYMGFIFYKYSKRYAGNMLSSITDKVPPTIKKVGVFVDEDPLKLRAICRDYKLDYVQLHGDEDTAYVKSLSEHGIGIIKAFRIDSSFSLDSVKSYLGICNYFLFDKAGDLKGGTGLKFDWSIISNYSLEVPFFLSGGIGPDDIAALGEIDNKYLHAVDINSRFELEPGLKNIKTISRFIDEIRKI